MYIITNSSLCCFVIPVVSAITKNSAIDYVRVEAIERYRLCVDSFMADARLTESLMFQTGYF